MRIQFIVPSIRTLTGGFRVVIEYCHELQKRSHQVTIIYPIWPYDFRRHITDWQPLIGRFYEFTMNLLHYKSPPSWLYANIKVLGVPLISNAYIPAADVTIATAWPTAYSLAKLNDHIGRRYYLIQGYETWSGPKKRVDDSWKLPLRRLVVSSWLKNIGQSQLHVDCEGPVMNGVNTGSFYNLNKVYNHPLHLGFIYNPQIIKGAKYVLEAMDAIHQLYPDITMQSFGHVRPPALPAYIDFFDQPSQTKIRELYNNWDIFISPSLEEGWGLPSMEAMACKCAVVTTNVGGVPDYTIAGKTAIVVPPADTNALVRGVKKLVTDSNLLRQISESGHQHMTQFTWERATDRLIKYIT